LTSRTKHTRRHDRVPILAELTADEIEQLRRPGIPLESWRKGEALFGQKIERLTRQESVRLNGTDVTKNPGTLKIKADKSELRKLVANTPQLVKDFEFFTKKLGWDPEGLLQYLYWDCNMMHASQQQLLAREKRSTWPIERESLEGLCDDIAALIRKLEALNNTDFSPARTVILRTTNGVPLPREQQRFLSNTFRRLPEILGFYSRELRRKVQDTGRFWSRHKERWRSMTGITRQESLYEKIRAKASKYHADRLLRLVNAARKVQGLEPLKSRAFVIWLNRLRARQEKEKSKGLPIPPTDAANL
jgi:hypothetical protein